MIIPLLMKSESLALKLGAQLVHPSLLRHVNKDAFIVHDGSERLILWKIDPDAFRSS